MARLSYFLGRIMHVYLRSELSRSGSAAGLLSFDPKAAATGIRWTAAGERWGSVLDLALRKISENNGRLIEA